MANLTPAQAAVISAVISAVVTLTICLINSRSQQKKMSEEMVHMQKLHNAVTQIIQEYRKTKGEPPADMLAVYEYLHGKQIEKAGDVKAKQTLFLG